MALDKPGADHAAPVIFEALLLGSSTAVLVVRGELTPADVPRLKRVARKHLSEGVQRLVIDLSGVMTLEPDVVPMVPRLQQECAALGARMGVCASGEIAAALQRGDASRHVPVYSSLQDAMGEGDEPPRLYARHNVEHDLASLHAARRWVKEALSAWALPESVHNAGLDISHELLANALQHGLPPVSLTLELGSRDLLVTVRDGSEDPAVVRPYRDGVSEGGLGMHLVGRLARLWGQRPEPPGKYVWASVHRADRVPAPR